MKQPSYWPARTPFECGIHMTEEGKWIVRCECEFESESYAMRGQALVERIEHMRTWHGLKNFHLMKGTPKGGKK